MRDPLARSITIHTFAEEAISNHSVNLCLSPGTITVQEALERSTLRAIPRTGRVEGFAVQLLDQLARTTVARIRHLSSRRSGRVFHPWLWLWLWLCLQMHLVCRCVFSCIYIALAVARISRGAPNLCFLSSFR